MKYTQNFNIQNYDEFSELSHKIIKEYCELFHLVASGLNAMIKRYSFYCDSNADMKHIVESCNQSFEYFVNSIPTLKTEHKKFEQFIENFEEITLSQPKTKINTEVGDWLNSSVLNSSEKKILENIDYLNNEYFQEALKEIYNNVENLSAVWQDENFGVFAEEILSGSRELVANFNRCSNQLKEHIMQNQNEINNSKELES